MKELFKNADADFYSMVDYVKSFTDDKNEDFNLFQLPPIQRNAVWNVAQIERLWDSILRGFPICSFLVSPRETNEIARDLNSGEQHKSAKNGYFLLDGQQRTRSLLLGFRSEINTRLWIDINPNLSFDNAELNDRKFLLRVITSYQPWGMSDRNPSEKLNENQKFNARQELGLGNLHYDYKVKIDNGFENGNSEFSWPVKAELPVPLDGLMKLCGGVSGTFSYPNWEEVCKLIPDRYHNLGKVPELETTHLGEICNALRDLIDCSNDAIRTRTIVLLYQKHQSKLQALNVQDDMEVLFRRVNAGGTILQGEEMAYSLLKSSWDGAYDMVSKIVKSESVGYLLSPTAIVMAATRLTRFIQNESDIPNPGISNFRRWIGESKNEETFLSTIQQLLEIDINEKSLFQNTLETFCELVLFKENNLSDIGIPKKLLLAIKPSLYHPVFVWIHKHRGNTELIKDNRNNVLRYLIYCFLTVEKYDKVSKIAIETIKQSEASGFPDKEIYNNLVHAQLTVAIPSPNDFAKPFEVPVDGFLRHWNEVFNLTGDKFNLFRQWFWHESKELLLWFQRANATKWFVGYDPTSGDAFDTPYDWDHIMPRSHLITSGASPVTHSNIKELNNKFDWNRSNYVNSIGNYRLWPLWGNRSDGNKCHTKKLRMENPNCISDSVAIELDLFSMQDFLNASAISPIDEQLWKDAGGDVRDWPEDRRIAWQNAVERRVCYLYEQLYTTFNFHEWSGSN